MLFISFSTMDDFNSENSSENEIVCDVVNIDSFVQVNNTEKSNCNEVRLII